MPWGTLEFVKLYNSLCSVAKNRSHRDDRRHNYDTFGAAASRVGNSYRGGFRGRRGGYYRGSQRGGFRYGNKPGTSRKSEEKNPTSPKQQLQTQQES